LRWACWDDRSGATHTPPALRAQDLESAPSRLAYSKDIWIAVLSDEMFEGVGHAFGITWANILMMIAGAGHT
jgi:hypothetical protein